MLADDREAFDAVLGEIFAGMDKPLSDAKREALWKGLAQMSLLELSRVRDLLLAEWQTSEPPKTLGVHELWQAKRRLRAPAPQPVERLPEWTGDTWDAAANRHLLAHVLRRAGLRKAITPDEMPVFLRWRSAWARDMRDACACGDYVNTTTGEVEHPPADVQRAAWEDCMHLAEAEIRQARAAA